MSQGDNYLNLSEREDLLSETQMLSQKPRRNFTPLSDNTEAAYYGMTDVESIEEVVGRLREKCQRPDFVQVLRVMHCNELTSLKGINVFQNLVDLNISSNNLITMSGLETIMQLQTVNLSCNKIA